MSLPRNPPRQFEPPVLTYAQLQGRLCAQEAFDGALDRLHEGGPRQMTFDEYLAAWGDVIELLIVKSDVSPEMAFFTSAERVEWLTEAIGTVIDGARRTFLAATRRIDLRGERSTMHDHIGVMRAFLISREFREANSFDEMVAKAA